MCVLEACTSRSARADPRGPRSKMDWLGLTGQLRGLGINAAALGRTHFLQLLLARRMNAVCPRAGRPSAGHAPCQAAAAVRDG
ncbi:uncharacterized protein B0I36DRAFT_320155 [Microdochium trichocladiopsis]|uniref:Uncharacterized protein n=1 Tax=Microdochium trichocladiopsis TaxID=1682393 RepID=A0A9P9BRF3_9PEZI|nr:uncharacterized protein B0I36DRAFT_320155 [Microdochium trichocladiopsis]KAH7032846.1 hypothetical protein B0I36DRAFT_320155 [Microdochium trichocladiopsis]